MSLIKHRPRIRLLLVPQIQPGKTFVATVVVEARREVPIEFIDVDLAGNEERSIGSGQYKMVRRRELCFLRARIDPERLLPAGRSQYRCRFTLPPSSPPTYSGDRVRVSYLMNVRAAIPWWPDARASFEVNVGPGSGRDAPEARPVLFSSRPEGPRANEPHIEGSLIAQVLIPGGVISGAIALSNVAYTRYAGLRLSLVGVEWVEIGARQSHSEAHRYEIHMPLDQPVEGEQYRFRMRLPEHVAITHREPQWSLSWFFECKAHIRWGQDLVLRLPVRVVPRRSRSTARRRRHAPPTVGSRRIQVLWQQIAEAHDLAFDGRRIYGRLSDSALAVTREHRGSGGVFLVGTLGYRSLDLDLAIEPRRGWLRSPGSRIRTSAAEWDRHHDIRVRDSSQLRAIEGPLRKAMTRFRLVRMTDDGAVVEVRNAGVSKARLDAFVRDLALFAGGLARARHAIPAPQLMRDHVAEWRELAGALGGSLETARMAVTGSLAGTAASVRTEWASDGAPIHTVVEVRPAMIIAEAHHIWLVARPGEPVVTELDDPPHAVRAALRDALAVEIAAESIAVTLPAPVAAPKQLLPRLRALCDWARQLSATAGPYR